MSRQVQLRRGTADEHKNFTGAAGEITIDTTTNTIRVHDGETAGGTALARASDMPQPYTIPDNYDFVIESGRTDTMWWRKYRSGTVDMGGHYMGNEATVLLPVQLANNNYEVSLSKNSSPSYWATTHITVAVKEAERFTVSTYGDNASLDVAWQITNAIAMS